jgi:hypothetical protein
VQKYWFFADVVKLGPVIHGVFVNMFKVVQTCDEAATYNVFRNVVPTLQDTFRYPRDGRVDIG